MCVFIPFFFVNSLSFEVHFDTFFAGDFLGPRPLTRRLSSADRPTPNKARSEDDSFAKAAVIINRGAVAALLSEKAVSLLPVGVIGVEGEFKKGDLLKIVDEDRHFLGVGKAAFGSDKLKRDIPAGHQKPLIHYDYLYLENGK